MNIFHLKINAVNLAPGFLISYTPLHRWKWIWKNGTYQKQFFTSWVPTWGLTRPCPFKLSHKYISSSIQFWQISFNVTLTEIQNFISNICRKLTAFLVHFLQLIQVHCTVQWNQVYNICHKIRLSFWYFVYSGHDIRNLQRRILHLCRICAWHGVQPRCWPTPLQPLAPEQYSLEICHHCGECSLPSAVILSTPATQHLSGWWT